jgi:prolyl-tRNA synthetase
MNESSPKSYEDLILQAELADYAPVRGCMVIRPYGYGIWENIQNLLNSRFKSKGVMNAAFPTLIPESFLHREKEHVEGFSPQCAVVTHGGGKKLEEPLVLRPTSETIINEMYAKWINSYRDLPVLINQWANVFRWELRTKLFLRTLEFLWQEGHTAHETQNEAQDFTIQMLQVYKQFLNEDLALYCISGEKSELERFAGAEQTFSVEVLLRDGKALQAGTSHFLGQNFAKVFNILYQDRNQGQSMPYQTSWGVSTRLIGALVLGHQDDLGLILPPKVASIQVVIIPIGVHKEGAILERCQKMVLELGKKGIRVKLDDRENVTPGWKFNEYELKGVPLRIELGKRDWDQRVATVVSRLNTQGKEKIPLDSVTTVVETNLTSLQNQLYERHKEFTLSNTHYPRSYDEFKSMVDEVQGFYVMAWDGRSETEETVQEQTKATLRCLPIPDLNEDLRLPQNTSQPLLTRSAIATPAYFAKSY